MCHRGLNVVVPEAPSSVKATTPILRPSHLGKEANKLRAGDMMPNADVRLAHSGKETLGVFLCTLALE